MLVAAVVLAVNGMADEPITGPAIGPAVGLAETDITPPVGFPMAGYFHERLCEGQIDPLKARAIVFRSEQQQAALVICDLIAVSADLSIEVRQAASEKTGIPFSNIAVAATHSHTAPDYSKTLAMFLRRRDSNLPPADTQRNADVANSLSESEREAYTEHLIAQITDAICLANDAATPCSLKSGWVEQQTPVSFNRRFVQRDGSVRTWVGLEHDGTVRSAGPIDPEIGLLLIEDPSGGEPKPRGVFSNFALHLDTVGGMKWSADYPFFIEQTLRSRLGPDCISIFGTGCCGDINHVNPRGKDRNKTDFIGNELGSSIVGGLGELLPIESPRLEVRSATVNVPLREVTPENIATAVRTMAAVKNGETVEFLDHVTAHRDLIIDQLRNNPSLAAEHESLLARRQTYKWAGIGDTLPIDILAITLGDDLAIVCLPGEVFVELGLAIKRASPFRTTMIIELTNAAETCYVPTRAAYAGGSYEVTNCTVAAGAGELLVEESLKLLRSAASRPPTP